MSTADETDVNDETLATEAEDAQVQAGADREPTAEEEAAAERAPELDESVKEAYRHQAEIGADVAGEGQIG